MTADHRVEGKHKKGLIRQQPLGKANKRLLRFQSRCWNFELTSR